MNAGDEGVAAARQAIDAVSRYYTERGIFQPTFGFGKRPALIIIDMAYGWTDPAYATGSVRLDDAVAGIQRLLPLCRSRDVPVIYTTSPFRADEEDPMLARQTGQYRVWDERACQIDARLRPEPGDFVIHKENAFRFGHALLQPVGSGPNLPQAHNKYRNYSATGDPALIPH